MLNVKWFKFFLTGFTLTFLSCHALAGEVDSKWWLESNGAKLYLEVSGRDSSKPLILFLHGGPGDVELGLIPFQVGVGRALEEKYLVAYLHQRGAGRSLEVRKDTLTIENNIEDVHNIVSFLKKRYKKDNVILIGHSWGGALAALYAREHPDDLEQVIFISSYQSAEEQAQTSLNATLQWAKKEGNQLAIQELKQYQESPTENYQLLSKWASRANGGIANGVDIRGFIADEKINEQFPGWQERRGNLAAEMDNELQAMSVSGDIDHLKLPALFVVGENDTITTPSQVRADYKRYRGSKCLMILKDSHHLPFMDAQEKLEKALFGFLDNGHCAA
ncbi:alpha/beta fold hydrolase [Microbulbifer discodermiae]|uniref:alpha/beta fold hydrolase n=1 Tax=Microbulbifer sp. 2201CG32-9 TaxID=3232309 RepID=UPI00345B6025